MGLHRFLDLAVVCGKLGEMPLGAGGWAQLLIGRLHTKVRQGDALLYDSRAIRSRQGKIGAEDCKSE